VGGELGVGVGDGGGVGVGDGVSDGGDDVTVEDGLRIIGGVLDGLWLYVGDGV